MKHTIITTFSKAKCSESKKNFKMYSALSLPACIKSVCIQLSGLFIFLRITLSYFMQPISILPERALCHIN